MIYYQEENLIIRDFERSDIEVLASEEMAQGWGDTTPKHLYRLEHRDSGRCVTLAAELNGAAVGYVSLYDIPCGGPFVDIPEIVDFNVIERCRCRGIGSRLMDVAEQLAAKLSDRVCLGVGLYSGYGAAQRMYVKRGYVFDGSGAWYNNKPAVPGETYPLDDDLNLFLSKKLR